MKLSEFTHLFPQHAIDFAASLRHQTRVYDGMVLDQVPLELEAEQPYQPGGRGRPNPNQTLTHSQCATCHRILRNDLYYTVPSMMKRNVVFPHCRECNQKLNASRHETRADLIKARRIVIWQFLAASCAVCGFDEHVSAIDLHHTANKESLVQELITRLTLSVDGVRAEALLREAAKCVPLCSNCHRMVHAGVLSLPKKLSHPSYRLADLLLQLRSPE